jgi:enoyl-CoA hydratase
LAETLRVEWGANDVLVLTLNRPERRNALDPDLLTALADALWKDGGHAGAVILRGANDEAFSSGYDLSRLTGTATDLEADLFIGEAARAIRECPAPVIARLAGHCHGAAVELALTCDLRIGCPTLRMSVPAVSLGVVYRYEFVVRLIQMCGMSRASTMLLGMRELEGQGAYAWGLLNEYVGLEELDGRVAQAAEKLATSPRAAVRGTKASFNLVVSRGVNGDDLARAQQLRTVAASSPERHEALQRRQKKRKE